MYTTTYLHAFYMHLFERSAVGVVFPYKKFEISCSCNTFQHTVCIQPSATEATKAQISFDAVCG